jgi:ketosteroid isomerase-like protein
MTPKEVSAAIDGAFLAYSNGDFDGFVNCFAEDLHYADTGGGPPIEGRAAFRDYALGWFNACSDRRIVPLRKIISGNEAAVELHHTGTHDRAPMYGLEPAGAKIDFHFAATLRLEGGQVTELKAWYSPLSTMQAIGLLGELPNRPTS